MEGKVRKRNLFLPNRGMRDFFGRTYSPPSMRFFQEYLETSRMSQWPAVRSDFWKQLNLACYHGNKEVIEFIMTNPKININNRRNDCHLSLLGSAFFGKKEWVVLRLLEHPQLDINKHVLAAFHYFVNNRLVHPLVQAAEKDMPNAVAKILAMSSLDINNLSRNFHPTTAQLELHSDMGEDMDLWYGKFTILEELFHKKKYNPIIKDLLNREGIEIKDKMYMFACVGNNIEGIELLHQKKPLSDERVIEKCFEYSVKYAAGETFEFLRKFLPPEKFVQLAETFSGEFITYVHHNIGCERIVPFFEKLFPYMSSDVKKHCLYEALENRKEEILLLFIEKEPLPLDIFPGYNPERHSYTLQTRVLHILTRYTELKPMFRVARHILKLLFEEPQDLHFYQELLWRMYSNIVEGYPFPDEEEIYRNGGLTKFYELRWQEKEFIYDLNSRIIQQYNTSIQALSEINLFTQKRLLPVDVMRHILKFVDEKWFLTKANFQHYNWIHYTSRYEEEDDEPNDLIDEFDVLEDQIGFE